MTTLRHKDRFTFTICLGTMSEKLPRLRDALSRQDGSAIQGLARELRNTVGLLALPGLYQLSQEIEYERATLAPSQWQNRCDRFCDLLERVQNGLQAKLAAN